MTTLTKKEQITISGGEHPYPTGSFVTVSRIIGFILDTVKNTGTDPL